MSIRAIAHFLLVMATCYACETELTDSTASNEHVILNACGGRWQSKELLCKKCNATFGDKCDSVLARQTNACTNLLGVVRHRGQPQKMEGKLKSSGEDYVIEPSGRPMLARPIVEEKEENGQAILSIVARDERELRGILKGYLKKYPNSDIEAMVKAARHTKEYLDEPITFSCEIGGEQTFRSVAKTVVNAYLLKGGSREYISHLLPYLRGESSDRIAWMHYSDRMKHPPDTDDITHKIKIVGDSFEGILYGYIELFNVHNYLIILNDSYSGPNMDADYVFDVLKGCEVMSCMPLKYTRNQVMNFIHKPQDDLQHVNFTRRFNWLLNIARRRQSEAHLEKLTAEAWNEFLKIYPEGTIMSKEIITVMVEIVSTKVAPFIARQTKLGWSLS